MKTTFSVVLLILICALGAKTEKYEADTRATKIHWLGKKTTGQHEGDVFLRQGQIIFQDGKPVSGNFIIDMNTITCTDIADPASNKDLVSHLKDADFFNVSEFPEAKLEITRLTPIPNADKDEPNFEAKGNLTIKGISNEVGFKARITQNGNTAAAQANIVVDRTKWNIVYKSKTVFSTLGDKFIYDDMTFTVNMILQNR